MSVINTKFNVGDKVYFIGRFLDLDDIENPNKLFEYAFNNVYSGNIEEITIDNKEIKYLVNSSYFTEDMLFLSAKDACIEILSALKTTIDNYSTNINIALKNTSENFEKTLKELNIDPI